MASLKRHWPLIFLLLIPIIPLWRAVFLGEAIGPFDQIRQFAPWNGPKPTDAWDVLQADGVLQFYVWRDLVFESWRNFQVPFWNPYQLAGTPLLANSQSGGLYPPHILMGVLHIPTALAITLLAWFHLFWAGLGVSKLARALGGSEIGGVVAGASFALSPFMLSWTALSSVITTVCWIPWLLMGLISIRDAVAGARVFFDSDSSQEIPRTRTRSLTKAMALTGTAVGMMILGGHLQFVAYGFMAATVFVIWLPFTAREKQFEEGKEPGNVKNPSKLCFAACLMPFVVGLAIGLPQLLPVLKHSGTSHRRVGPTEAGYESYVGSAIKPFELANLVTSKALGDPRTPVDVNENLSVAEYWPPLAKQGANFAESAVTIGPLVLGLLFLVPWRDRRTWPLVAIGLLALLLAMGTILNKALYFWLPGWSSTGSPGRIIVLFVLVACVLAGLAVREVSKRQVAIAIGGMAVFLLITAMVLPGTAPHWQQGMEQVGEMVKGVSSAGLPIGVITSVAVGFGLLLLLPKAEAPHAIDPIQLLPAVPLFLVLAGYSANLIPSGKPLAPIEPSTSALGRVAIINDNWGIIAAAKDAFIPPNLSALSRIKELAGYDSLLNRDTKTMLDDINGQDSAPPANGNIMFTKSTVNPQKLQEAGIEEVWSARPVPSLAGIEPRQQNGYLVYPMGTGLYAYASEGDAGADQKSPGRIEVAWEQDVPEVHIKERWMPGWTAGPEATVEPLNEEGSKAPWIKVIPKPGAENTVLTYVAPGYSTGLLLAIPAWLVALAGCIFTGRKARSEPEVQ